MKTVRTDVQTANANLLDVRLFGRFAIYQNGELVSGLRSQKTRWLFAYLVLKGDAVTPFHELATTFWPAPHDSQALPAPENVPLDAVAQDRGIASVRQSLSNLRAALGPQIFARSERSTVKLDLSALTVDVYAFDAAIAEGAIETLCRAVDLYTGDLLVDCTGAWIVDARVRRKRRFLAALDALAERSLATGDEDAAARYLTRRIAAAPHAEEGWVALLRMHVRRCDWDAARTLFTECCTALAEVDRAPGPALQRLHDTIPGRTAARPHDPPAGPPPRYNLPYPSESLLGRENDLDVIAALFHVARFVALQGSPGVGKTEIARHFASRAATYPDGAAFVDLTEMRAEHEIGRALATTLNLTLPEPSNQEISMLMGVLRQFIGSRHMLIVLDGCDHLTEPAARFCIDLLGACPGLHLLTTGGFARSAAGGRLFHVRPLDIPPANLMERPPAELVGLLPAYASVQLYLREAVRVQPALALTERTAPTIAQLCRFLQGIPRTVQFTARLVRFQNPEATLAALLHNRDPFMGPEDGPNGMNPMRSALEVGFGSLPPHLREMLTALAVFRGGWTREAAAAILDHAAVEDDLAELQDRSLIVADLREEGVRLRLLETIRPFCAERLALSSATDDLRTRHLVYCVQLAESLEQELSGRRKEPTLTKEQALNRMEQEWENFQAALEWAEATGATESGLRLATALWRFCYIRGYNQEGLRWLDTMLAAGRDASPVVRSRALGAAANLALQRGDGARARTLCEDRLAAMETLGDPAGIAGALGSLGSVATTFGDPATARGYFERSLQISRSIEDLPTVARTLGNLAIIACKEQNYARAGDYHEESIDLWRRLGDPQNLVTALNNLAGTCMETRSYPTAVRALRESAALCLEKDNRYGLVQCLFHYFCLAVRFGLMERAALLLGGGDAHRERIGLPLHKSAVDAYHANSETVRNHLVPANVFDAAIARGRAMPLQELVDYTTHVFDDLALELPLDSTA